MNSKESRAAVSHSGQPTASLDIVQLSLEYSSITTALDHGSLGLKDEMQLVNDCILAKNQLHRCAEAAALAPTVLCNHPQDPALKVMQQHSACVRTYAVGHRSSLGAGSAGIVYTEQPLTAGVLCSFTSLPATASCTCEARDPLQGMSALPYSRHRRICSSSDEFAPAPASSVCHQLTRKDSMGMACTTDCGANMSGHPAYTLWEEADSYTQLCNNSAGGAAVVSAANHGQHVHWDDPSVAAAVAAGCTSACRRLFVTDLTVYPNSSCSSGVALAQANRLMANTTLPDGITFMAVLEDSFLFKAATAWQFPAFAVCLGSSYLQRMMARLPHLADAMRSCPGFQEYTRDFMNHQAQTPSTSPTPKLHGAAAISTTATLRSIQLTCLFLATKVADQVHALELLRFMLSQVSIDGHVVSKQEVLDIELHCLDALDWRLGPYFADDETLGDDLAMWLSK